MVDAQILCANPVVAVYDGVFDAAEAAHIIAQAPADMQQAPVQTLAETTLSETRTNTQARLDQWSDPVMTEICQRVSALVRLPPENCEPAKLLHYEGDQKFDLHHDAFSSIAPNGLLEMANGGQRLFTTLLYLNDVEAGGETDFPLLKVSVRPRLGRVLLFANTEPGTTDRHAHAQHAGRPITSGEKWVLSLWWRERLFHVPRSYPPEDGEMRHV